MAHPTGEEVETLISSGLVPVYDSKKALPRTKLSVQVHTICHQLKLQTGL